MQLVPAPLRQFKTWSMILLIVAGLFDLSIVLLHTLTEMHIVSTQTVALINAGFAFATGAVKLIQQQIALTTEQKVALVSAAASQPVHPGEENITVTIQDAPLPAFMEMGD